MLKMRPRTLELTCSMVRWTVLACAAWILVSTAFLRKPLREPRIVEDSAVSAADLSPEPRNSLASLESIWQRNLRQRLVEPEPEPAPPEPPPPPPVRLPKLLATFVEHGQAWGLFVDEKGGLRVLPAGGEIDGFEVVTLSNEEATLRRGDRTYTVDVPRSTDGAHAPRSSKGRRR